MHSNGSRQDQPEKNDPEGNSDWLDADFPLGDGVADRACEVVCPYCFATVEITLDPGSGPDQQYVEDCEVCCQPWNVSVSYDEAGMASVQLEASDS